MDAGVILHVDDKSDHEPVYCVVKIKDTIEVNDDAVGSVSSKPRPCWKSATPEQREHFKESLKVQLEDSQVPPYLSSCSNCSCKMKSILKTDKFVMETLETLGTAADCCANNANIPKGRKKSCMPGWSAQLKPFRDNACFWFSVWKSASRPLNTELHRKMKRTRNLYHYHVKKCRKSEDLIKRNNFLYSCLNGSADIFTEIKKLRKSEKVVANSIDGRVENIEEHFAGVYKNLYNSVDDIYKNVESIIDSKSIEDVEKVTPDIVMEAVSRLNHLSIIIKRFLLHAHASNILLLSTLVPIIKDKMGDICSSQNYRSIAISSLILKVVDWVVIILYGECLNLDDLQFSYQSGCSTMCTWLTI